MLTVILAALMLGPVQQTGAIPVGRGNPVPGRGAVAQEAPPAPAPGSPGIYKSSVELIDALKAAAANTTEMVSSPVSNTDQYRVNLVHRSKPAGAIAHPGNTELHYITEGSGTIVTGGTIVRPAGSSAAAATIQNGVTKHVTKGDVIIIPANTPHWYRDIEGTITYLEVRFVAPK
jgi:mannose-6-phosphate isomerase-like protein (cupin superfamily)